MNKISLLEYSKLSSTKEYDSILKHLKPKNIFGGGTIDFNKLSYKEVRSCLSLTSKLKGWEDLKELFSLAFNTSVFWEVSIIEFFAAQNYLLKTLKDLQSRETKLLQSIDADSGLWVMAEGDKLNKFSNIMPLIQLGEIYSIYPYDLQDKPYNEILLLLVAHKERNEVQSNYSKLKNK